MKDQEIIKNKEKEVYKNTLFNIWYSSLTDDDILYEFFDNFSDEDLPADLYFGIHHRDLDKKDTVKYDYLFNKYKTKEDIPNEWLRRYYKKWCEYDSDKSRIYRTE